MSWKVISAQRHVYLIPHADKLRQYTQGTLQKNESPVWIHKGIIQKQLLYQMFKSGACNQQIFGYFF